MKVAPKSALSSNGASYKKLFSTFKVLAYGTQFKFPCIFRCKREIVSYKVSAFQGGAILAVGNSLYRFVFKRPWLIAALFALCLCGCVKTEISPPKPSPELEKLANINARPLPVVIETSTDFNTTAGHQFLLFLLPLGRIEIVDPKTHLERAAYKQLALRGYTPLIGEAASQSPQQKTLHFRIDEISLSGFDYMALRNNKCQVSITSQLFGADNAPLRAWTGKSEASFIHRYAFAPELERALSQALERGIDDAMNHLSL